MRTICDAVDSAGLQVGRPPRYRINAWLVSDKKTVDAFLRNLAVFHSLSLTIEHEIEISHAGH